MPFVRSPETHRILPVIAVRTLALTLTLAAAAPTGCGGSAPAEDNDDAVIAAIVAYFTIDHPESKCVKTVSMRFVRAVYGDVTACRAAHDIAETSVARAATVSEITVAGDRAQASVRLSGGNSSRASGGGRVRLVRADSAWLVDKLDIAVLRDRLQARATTSNNREVNRCVTAGLGRLADRKLRALAYGFMARRPAAETRVNEIYTKCRILAGTELGVVQDALAERLMDGQLVRCSLRELRRTQSDASLLQLADGRPNPTGARAIRSAVRVCRSRR